MGKRFMFMEKKNVPRVLSAPVPGAIYMYMHMAIIFKHL